MDCVILSFSEAVPVFCPVVPFATADRQTLASRWALPPWLCWPSVGVLLFSLPLYKSHKKQIARAATLSRLSGICILPQFSKAGVLQRCTGANAFLRVIGQHQVQHRQTGWRTVRNELSNSTAFARWEIEAHRTRPLRDGMQTQSKRAFKFKTPLGYDNITWDYFLV